jgi:hypothetical protein
VKSINPEILQRVLLLNKSAGILISSVDAQCSYARARFLMAGRILFSVPQQSDRGGL